MSPKHSTLLKIDAEFQLLKVNNMFFLGDINYMQSFKSILDMDGRELGRRELLCLCFHQQTFKFSIQALEGFWPCLDRL